MDKSEKKRLKEAKREAQRLKKEKYERERCYYKGTFFRCTERVVPGQPLCEYHANIEAKYANIAAKLAKEKVEYKQRIEKALYLKVPTVEGLTIGSPYGAPIDVRNKYLREGRCLACVFGYIRDVEVLFSGSYYVCGKPVATGSPLCEEHTKANDAIVERAKQARKQ
ncbi:MAG: hypothetical protein ACE5IC_10565 [Candidatus Brocadiales bacterium]